MGGQQRETASEVANLVDLAPAPASFGDALRSWRAKRGVSLAGLAKLVHYSKGYLSKIETGDKPVTVDVARRCDEALDAGGTLSQWIGTVRSRHADTSSTSNPGLAETIDSCPYPGLVAFGPHDSRWFFGRERDLAHLLTRVTER